MSATDLEGQNVYDWVEQTFTEAMSVGTRKTSLARTAYFVPVIAAFFSHEYNLAFMPKLHHKTGRRSQDTAKLHNSTTGTVVSLNGGSYYVASADATHPALRLLASQVAYSYDIHIQLRCAVGSALRCSHTGLSHCAAYAIRHRSLNCSPDL